MNEHYKINEYLRINNPKLTDLEFDDNYIHATIKSTDYTLEIRYKTRIGTVMDYIEYDLEQLNKDIINVVKRYWLSKVKGKGDE